MKKKKRYSRTLLIPFLLLSTVALIALYFINKKNPPVPAYIAHKIIIQKGDTFENTLAKMGLPSLGRKEITDNFSKVFPLKRIMPGNYFEIVTDTSSIWLNFAYYTKGREYYSVIKTTSGIETAKKLRPVKRTLQKADGQLTKTLWEAMSEQGVRPGMILDFADIFAWQIDFLTEPRAGDTFAIIYESEVMDNGETLNSKILGAKYTASGKPYVGILFNNEKGEEGYYSADGKSLAKAFLRAPLQYRRISSRFTNSRYHPIFKYFRPHLGIDYAAPSGTPVSAIGNGQVIYRGWKGGFGNFLQIRHSNGYISGYGHLLSFRKGLGIGSRVGQGEVVGYVGSTGNSTGPHLDFRFQKDGRFINFMNLKIPPTKSLTSKEMDQFKDMKQTVFRKFAEARFKI